jgi:hypothetical protein
VSRISSEERLRRAQASLKPIENVNYSYIIQEKPLVDASQDALLESWTDPPFILAKLRDQLPFSQVLGSQEYDNLVDQTLPRIADAALEQLLYWHLADATNIHNCPADTILLWNSDSHLWFLQVFPQQDSLINRILGGERIRYLERFRLDHSEIQLSFHEIRLVTQSSNHRLVITEGRELTYRWSRSSWETTLENPDRRQVDPEVHHFPPEPLKTYQYPDSHKQVNP